MSKLKLQLFCNIKHGCYSCPRYSLEFYDPYVNNREIKFFVMNLFHLLRMVASHIPTYKPSRGCLFVEFCLRK